MEKYFSSGKYFCHLRDAIETSYFPVAKPSAGRRYIKLNTESTYRKDVLPTHYNHPEILLKICQISRSYKDLLPCVDVGKKIILPDRVGLNSSLKCDDTIILRKKSNKIRLCCSDNNRKLMKPSATELTYD